MRPLCLGISLCVNVCAWYNLYLASWRLRSEWFKLLTNWKYSQDKFFISSKKMHLKYLPQLGEFQGQEISPFSFFPLTSPSSDDEIYPIYLLWHLIYLLWYLIYLISNTRFAFHPPPDTLFCIPVLPTAPTFKGNCCSFIIRNIWFRWKGKSSFVLLHIFLICIEEAQPSKLLETFLCQTACSYSYH